MSDDLVKSTDRRVRSLLNRAKPKLPADVMDMLRDNDNYGGLSFDEWKRVIDEQLEFAKEHDAAVKAEAAEQAQYDRDNKQPAMLLSTDRRVVALIKRARVPADDPLIVQHDPHGGLPLEEWKQQISDLAGGLDWADENEGVMIAPDVKIVAAHLFATTGTGGRKLPGWSDAKIDRALLIRAEPWDHAREVEINGGKPQRPVEFSDGGLADELQDGLMLALVECFACPVTRNPVKVRVRNSTERGGYQEPGQWSEPVVLDTVYKQGGRESPAVQALMGATDPTGRMPSRPSDPAKCKEYEVATLKGRATSARGEYVPPTVKDAIRRMSRSDRSLWTRSGKPKVSALTRMMRRRVTAKERDAAWKR